MGLDMYFEGSFAKRSFIERKFDERGKCEIDPDFGLAHQNRGISNAFSGDIDGACSDWNKAVELGVTLPESVASIDCN